jgi:hypothetical protein
LIAEVEQLLELNGSENACWWADVTVGQTTAPTPLGAVTVRTCERFSSRWAVDANTKARHAGRSRPCAHHVEVDAVVDVIHSRVAVQLPDGHPSLQGNIWTLQPTSGHWRQVTRDTGFAITDLDWGPAPPTDAG